MVEKKLYVECRCSSPEHRLVFKLDQLTDHEPPELYTEVHLHQYNNIFKRIWIAIKYIFGYKSKYGHFDCTIFQSEDVPPLVNLLVQYAEKHDAWIDTLEDKN